MHKTFLKSYKKCKKNDKVILKRSLCLMHHFSSCKIIDLLEIAKMSCRKNVSQYFIVTFLFTEARPRKEER